MLSNNWIQNWGGYKANEWKTFLKSAANIVQRKLSNSKPVRLYLLHFIRSTIDVCVLAFLWCLLRFFFAPIKAYAHRDLLVFYVRAMLNSKLAKFNKISTQSQLRSNSLDFILSQLLLTSSLCLFAHNNRCSIKRDRDKRVHDSNILSMKAQRRTTKTNRIYFFGRRHSIDSSVTACILLFRQKFLHFLFTFMWSNALWFAGCCGCCC